MATKKSTSKSTKSTIEDKAVRKTTGKLVTPTLSTSQKALHEKIRDSLAGAQKVTGSSGGGKFSFFKLDEEKNRFRIVIPPNGPFCLTLKQHRGIRFGKFGTATDLGWLYNNTKHLDAMKERFSILPEDDKCFNKYGEPYDILFKALQAMGKQDEFTDARIGSKRAIFVVWANDSFHILETSLTFAQAIETLYEADPDFIDWEDGKEIQVTGKGKKLQRRYSPPVIVGKPSPIKFDPEEHTVPDLYDFLSAKTLGYQKKVKFLFNSHPKLVNLANLSTEDFGVEEIEEEETDNEE